MTTQFGLDVSIWSNSERTPGKRERKSATEPWEDVAYLPVSYRDTFHMSSPFLRCISFWSSQLPWEVDTEGCYSYLTEEGIWLLTEGLWGERWTHPGPSIPIPHQPQELPEVTIAARKPTALQLRRKICSEDTESLQQEETGLPASLGGLALLVPNCKNRWHISGDPIYMSWRKSRILSPQAQFTSSLRKLSTSFSFVFSHFKLK